MDGAKEFLTSNTFEGKTNTSHLTKRSFEIMNFEELSGFSYTFKLTCSYIPVTWKKLTLLVLQQKTIA